MHLSNSPGSILATLEAESLPWLCAGVAECIIFPFFLPLSLEQLWCPVDFHPVTEPRLIPAHYQKMKSWGSWESSRLPRKPPPICHDHHPIPVITFCRLSFFWSSVFLASLPGIS